MVLSATVMGTIHLLISCFIKSLRFIDVSVKRISIRLNKLRTFAYNFVNMINS